MKSDRDKSRARDRYLIVRIDGEWCFIKKFTGSQLRATSYKVKLAECYGVSYTVPPVENLSISPPYDEDDCGTTFVPPPPCQPLPAQGPK